MSIYNSNLPELPFASQDAGRIEAFLIERPHPEVGAVTVRESAEVLSEDGDENLLKESMGELSGEQEVEVDSSAVVQRMATEAPRIPRGELVWKFLINPERIRFQGGDAEYETLLPHLNTAPHVAFKGNSSRTIEFSDLWLETWFESRSVQPLLDGIRRLQEANPNNREYEPPTMTFVFGSRRIEPVKVVKAAWVENKWLSGAPAGARMTLTLQEIPEESVSDPYEPPPPPVSDLVDESSLVGDQVGQSIEPLALTARQIEEMAQVARSWLVENANIQGFSPTIAQTLSQEDFILKLKTNGTALVADSEGLVLGKLGTWDHSSILEDWEPTLIDLPMA